MNTDDGMKWLEDLLFEGDDRRVAEALTTDFQWLTDLPPRLEQDDPAQPSLPPQAAIGIFLGVRALLRRKPDESAWAFIETALSAYATAHPRGRRAYVRHTALSDALADYPNLRIVVVEALLSARQWLDAAAALRDLVRQAHPLDAYPDVFTEKHLGPLAARAASHSLGPVALAPGEPQRAWTLARLRELALSGHLDETRTVTWWVYAEYLVEALKAGAAGEAADFVDAKASAAWPVENRHHYAFNAICVLAQAGRLDDAVGATRELVRRGYDMLWRFNPDRAEAMWWTKRMGQGEWLASLHGQADFEALKTHYMTPVPRHGDGPQAGPFASIEQTQLTGKSKKRCALSRKLIEPGDAIYRFRPFGGGASDPFVAAKAAFEASELASWHRKHVTDGYEPHDFAVTSPLHAGQFFAAPAAAAFLFDLVEGRSFDAEAFIGCIAAPLVHPMRFEWIRGKFDYSPAPEDGPQVNDAVAGDYVSLTWIMLRCGFGPEIFRRLSQTAPEIADPIYAMLATFDRDDCRMAAAAHFALESLPEMIEIAFRSRLSLDDILSLADFGRDHQRFAEALSKALATYNLHIYSNTHPQVDWYLDGLQHYSLAKSSRLTFFLIDRPDLLPVLQKMLENGHLVTGQSAGGYDGYENLGHFLYQAAVTNRLRHAPAEVAYWLETPWIEHYVRGPTMRDVKKSVVAYTKCR